MPAASLVQAFGEGLVRAFVDKMNWFGVYCGAAGRGQLTFEVCGPSMETDSSVLSAMAYDQVFADSVVIDENAGVLHIHYKVTSRGALDFYPRKLIRFN